MDGNRMFLCLTLKQFVTELFVNRIESTLFIFSYKVN
jgi:hypothetical protein